MQGLSRDIEIAVDVTIEGLEYPIDTSTIDSDKLKNIVKAKTDSFKYTKELLLKWQNSNNAPSEDKLKSYVNRLVKAGDMSLNVLRSALRERIDYAELDPSKHAMAISAKPIIHQAIVEIDASLLELRLQLDADNINLKDNEFKRGYPEKYASGELFPLKNYYKNWLDNEKDSVCICPHGTKGEIINLDGLNITLPKVPDDKKKILFYNKKKKDQYWTRLDVPKGLSPDNEDAYAEYIIEEFRRRREGVWFFNNGEPVYLTGTHYFALQWVKMEDSGGYMDFRHAQKNMYYFTKACIVDTRCLGELFVKSRRTGFTYQIICEMLNDSTSTINSRLGITSKSDSDAEKAFSKFSYGFLNLPFFFQPVVKGTLDSKKLLEFAKPSDRSKAAKKKQDTNTDGYLNTLIDYMPTVESSYDGQKMFRYLADESSKWIRGANFEKHWGQVSPTFDEGGKIVGKAFVGSTVNAMNKGGAEFKSLYLASDIKKRDKTTDRTPSGLYSFFLPAHKNMTEFTDIYGVCHETVDKGGSFINVNGVTKSVGSIAYLEAKRKAKRKENDIAYNEELRAFPMTTEEAFRDELVRALFNTEKINEQKIFNDSINIDSDLVRGRFAWKDGIPDTTVEWHPDNNGRFLVSWIPAPGFRNRFELRNGFGGNSKYPLNDDIGAFGCDPYDISGTVEGVSASGHYNEDTSRASKGALHGLTGFTMKDAPSNTFFLQYVARPSTAEIFFEDVLMACVFYGMPILAENNKPRLLYHFKNRGYRNFAITRFDKALNRLSPTEKELGGMPNSSEDIKQMHASAIEAYIDKYVGMNHETEEYGSMPFNLTLDDWMKFDINNRTKYDASISSGLAIMAVNRRLYSTQHESKPITVNIKRYNNR
jgi:hypothetical protein